LQQKLIDAVAPFTAKTGTVAAFVSTEEGRDIQPALIDYMANFGPASSGKNFNPHVTIGVAPQMYLNNMLEEKFESFTFSPIGGRCLPARQLRNRSKETNLVGAQALTPTREISLN